MPHGGPHQGGPSGQAYQAPATMDYLQYLLGHFFEQSYMQNANWWDYTTNPNAWSGMEDIFNSAAAWQDLLDFQDQGGIIGSGVAWDDFVEQGGYQDIDWDQQQAAWNYAQEVQDYQDAMAAGSPVYGAVYVPPTEGTFGQDTYTEEGDLAGAPEWTTFFSDWDFDWGSLGFPPGGGVSGWPGAPGGNIGGSGDIGTGGFMGGGSPFANIQGGIQESRDIWQDTLCDDGPIFGGSGECIACCELMHQDIPPGDIESTPGGKASIKSAPKTNPSLQNKVRRRY